MYIYVQYYVRVTRTHSQQRFLSVESACMYIVHMYIVLCTYVHMEEFRNVHSTRYYVYVHTHHSVQVPMYLCTCTNTVHICTYLVLVRGTMYMCTCICTMYEVRGTYYILHVNISVSVCVLSCTSYTGTVLCSTHVHCTEYVLVRGTNIVPRSSCALHPYSHRVD